MTLPSEAAPRVINNTIILNLVGIRVDRRIGTASQIHRNNIEVANTVGLQVDFGSEGENPVWQHNLVHANETDYSGLVDPTGTDGNLSADPQFVDVVAGDYRLEPGSPAIDAGALVLVPPTDFDGVPRSRDGNGDGVDVFDIGAFEAGRAITISPPTGTYVRTQPVDLVILAEGTGEVVGGAVTVDGQDVSAPPPISEWDGLRRLKISRLQQVVDNEWATWSLPGIVCYGDSGAPTFFNDHPFASRSRERVVAVASDGSNVGEPCFTRDVRARVDTQEAQDWIRQTIADAVGGHGRHD
jgi:hypothetical protein